MIYQDHVNYQNSQLRSWTPFFKTSTGPDYQPNVILPGSKKTARKPFVFCTAQQWPRHGSLSSAAVCLPHAVLRVKLSHLHSPAPVQHLQTRVQLQHQPSTRLEYSTSTITITSQICHPTARNQPAPEYNIVKTRPIIGRSLRIGLVFLVF